jgi:hypothetical protein
MDPLKIIGICNRIKITPPANRKPLVAELVAAIDEGKATPTKLCATNDLRDTLAWDEVKANPSAVATIARTLRSLRESE